MTNHNKLSAGKCEFKIVKRTVITTDDLAGYLLYLHGRSRCRASLHLKLSI